MEFVNKSEVGVLLREHGYDERPDGPDRVYLAMHDESAVVHVHLGDSGSEATPREGATVVEVTADGLPAVVEQILHRLNLVDVLLIPVGKWRNVFDAVAFSLAANEAWQEIDAAATVELNTRDPLWAGHNDHPLVIDLIRALISDADSPEQGLILTSTAIPVIVEIVPVGAIRLSIGNQALADQIVDVVGV